MDAARLQSKLYSGYGKAAKRIGYLYTIYRPQNATNPIVSGNIIGTPFNAQFTPRAQGFNFQVTSDYKNALWHGLFDATNVNVGDYLVNTPHGTYFVIAKQDQLPILCVNCNNVVSVLRAEASNSVGVQSYMGATPSTEVPIITSWPASVIYDARGRNTGAMLPMDEVNPYFTVLLPSFPGIDIRASDIITDNDTPIRRYIVTSSELSPRGWRIVARHVVA